MTIHLMGTVVAVLAIVAIGDYLFQYRTWYERQKMSLQEIKEEFKQSEGDPAHQGPHAAAARGADEEAHDGGGAEGLRDHHQPDPLFGRAAIRARHGGAGRVWPRAPTTSPSRSGRSRASTTSRSSRTCALARALYATVEIDEEIPVEHYQAVAEVIGYVMGLKRSLSGRRP